MRKDVLNLHAHSTLDRTVIDTHIVFFVRKTHYKFILFKHPAFYKDVDEE